MLPPLPCPTQVNEAPSPANVAVSIPENLAVSSNIVTSIPGNDPDAGTVYTYTIQDGNQGGRYDPRARHLCLPVPAVAHPPTHCPCVAAAPPSLVGDVHIGVCSFCGGRGPCSAPVLLPGPPPVRFAISSTTGQITLAAALNFEALPTGEKFYVLLVRVADQFALAGFASVNIAVTNVNEMPTTSNVALSVFELTAVNTVLSTTVRAHAMRLLALWAHAQAKRDLWGARKTLLLVPLVKVQPL